MDRGGQFYRHACVTDEKVIHDESFHHYNEGILHHDEGVDVIPTNIELSGMDKEDKVVMDDEKDGGDALEPERRKEDRER